VRQSATTPPRRGRGRDSLASRRTGHGRRGTQRSTKCASAGHRNLPNWATQPGRLMAWGTGQALAVPQPPGIYTMGRAQRPARLPLAVPSATSRHGPSTHPCRGRSDARATTAALWVPRGCPLTPSFPPARIGHFGPLATVRAVGSHTPPRTRVSGVSPIPFGGAGHGVTPTHLFARRFATPRLVATCGVRGGGSVDLRPLAGTARISLPEYVAYLPNVRILGPVAPLTGQYSRGGLN